MVNKKDNLPTTASKKAVAGTDTIADKLLADLVGIIEGRKQTVCRQANSGSVLMFWEVGKRVNEEILGNERAEYGKQILSMVSTKLQERYGHNFALRRLRRMLQFDSQFSDARTCLHEFK
jgi:hypothetical protein